MGIRSEDKDSIRKAVGQLGESVACSFLKDRGYRVLARNYRKPWGEIDVIAEKGGIVHFVEVKAVSVDELSRENNYHPEEMATDAKLRKVARTAALYMDSEKDDREFQIDVIGVLIDQKKRIARCRFFDQVLEG